VTGALYAGSIQNFYRPKQQIFSLNMLEQLSYQHLPGDIYIVIFSMRCDEIRNITPKSSVCELFSEIANRQS
jgi:hypothetical protein